MQQWKRLTFFTRFQQKHICKQFSKLHRNLVNLQLQVTQYMEKDHHVKFLTQSFQPASQIKRVFSKPRRQFPIHNDRQYQCSALNRVGVVRIMIAKRKFSQVWMQHMGATIAHFRLSPHCYVHTQTSRQQHVLQMESTAESQAIY